MRRHGDRRDRRRNRDMGDKKWHTDRRDRRRHTDRKTCMDFAAVSWGTDFVKVYWGIDFVAVCWSRGCTGAAYFWFRGHTGFGLRSRLLDLRRYSLRHGLHVELLFYLRSDSSSMFASTWDRDRFRNRTRIWSSH